jgi:hypothetical protein
VSSSGSASARATTSASSAAADPLADLTATAILNKAAANVTAASSVHFAGYVTDSGMKITMAFTVVRGKGCAGMMSTAKDGSVQLVVAGKTGWMKPDAAFWKYALGNSKTTDPQLALALLNGKWLKGSTASSNLSWVTSLCSLSGAFGQATPSTDDIVKGAVTTLNGQRVLTVTDVTQPSTAWVTDAASPELLRITSTSGTDPGTLTFSGYGAPFTITPPPAGEVIDGTKFGF